MGKKETILKTWLVSKLRKLSYQWPNRRIAQQKARISRGLYECAECKRQGKTGLWGPKDISADHINPIVPESGWDDWDGYIVRLFCPVEDYQILCDLHHDEKTLKENENRRKLKKRLDNDDEI